MGQTIFDTRQRAKELMEEAIRIWRQSDSAEELEGLEKDPVFNMLMTAVAFRENETDSEIERLKQDVADEFARIVTPFEAGHAVPATAVVETMPYGSIPDTTIDTDTVFQIAGGYNFMPLFKSRVLNLTVKNTERIDGRRWKVTLSSTHPVNDLSGLCFAIRGVGFRNLSLTCKGKKLRLTRPWNYCSLPFTACFDAGNTIYNYGENFNVSTLPLDLFARQNVRLFWIDDSEAAKVDVEKTEIDLIFEFFNISDSFVFDSSNISLNAILLVNATLKDATVSSLHPITRLTGVNDRDSASNTAGEQFLQLLRPADWNPYGALEPEIRRVNADRFNQGSLLRLLTSLVNKYHTDFYAFQHFAEMKSDKVMTSLQDSLRQLIRMVNRDVANSIAGVYLLIRDRGRIRENFSLTVKYLVTSGAAVNPQLNEETRFRTPAGIDENLTRQIAEPVQGLDEIKSESVFKSLLKYHLLTGDRIITSADIKYFCYYQLNRLYSLGEENIKHIKVNSRRAMDDSGVGYEICVDITLPSTNIIKRSLEDKIPTLEIVLQKMMECRSSGVYPIRVNVMFEN